MSQKDDGDALDRAYAEILGDLLSLEDEERTNDEARAELEAQGVDVEAAEARFRARLKALRP